jgi:hypothetical protein
LRLHWCVWISEIEGRIQELHAANPTVPIKDLELDFDALLIAINGGIPSRRDRAVAFYQLLILKSLDIIDVKQDQPYDNLIIKVS